MRKMQAVLVLKIYNFDNILTTYGAQKSADIVFRMRTIANKYIDVFRYSGDMVMTIVSSVQEAIDRGQDIMDMLYSSNIAIPLCGAIGWGTLYRTIDRDYWGIELNRTIDLASAATSGSILLTQDAQAQVPGDANSCPI